MQKLAIFLSFLIASYCGAHAQGVYAPSDPEYTDLIQRYEIIGGENFGALHSSFKPYTRSDIAKIFENDSLFISPADKFNQAYLLNDNHEWTESESDPEKAFLKHFYQKKANAYHTKFNDELEIHADPILHFQAGYDLSESINSNNPTNSTDKSRNFYTNTRGIAIRGMIDNKVGFFTSLTENQMRMPYYVQNRIESDTVIPGEGFWKNFGSNGYDFFNARGYITFNASKHIRLQFGNDRNFVGNGYRSLILSDFAAPYLFMKVETQIWKLKYTNIFAQLTADYQRSGRLFPRKYMAFHHLSMNIGKKLNVGIFESVIYGRPDDNGPDLAYLNPIIFYRAIEQNLGSPDNATVGIDWRYMAFNKISFYGQFILDELIVSNLRAGNGWWGNKFGFQGGVKYINVLGVDNLDLQVETNILRPYTYAHTSDFTNYQHYQQPLAHPMGANFHELISRIRFQVMPKLTFSSNSFYINIGRDSPLILPNEEIEIQNQGSNIRNDYRDRPQDFGNRIGQGIPESILLSENTISFMMKHNFFIDLSYTYRRSSLGKTLVTPNVETLTSHIIGLGLRWNAAQRHFNF